MKIIPIITGLVSAGGTYYAVRNAPIPMPAKIVASLAAGGAGYYVGTKISGTFAPPTPGEEIVGAAQTEMQQLLKKNQALPPDQRQLPTVTPAQMKVYANNLYTAMDGAGTNWTDTKAVIDKMNSDVDILNLIAAFGTRHGSSWFASSDDEDLSTWLAADGVTADVNAILETKPMISYRF